MKIESEELTCKLSGRVYTTIYYLDDVGEGLKDLSTYITHKHGKIDRELVKRNGLSGYKISIIKERKK